MSSVVAAARVHRQLPNGAVSESEGPFRLIIDTMPAFAWYASPDGKLEYLNQRILDYTGQHLEDLLGFGWVKVLHPEDVERTKKAWLHSVENGEPCDVDQRVRRFDNVYRWFRTIAQPLRDHRGRVIRWCGVATDIEDLKRSEEKLRRSESSLLHAQRISRTGSWRHDFLAGTVTVSPEVYRIFGVKPDEVTSNTELWINVIHPEDRKRVQGLFESSKINKTDFLADYRILLADGTIKHLHSVGHPMLNESGHLVEFFGTTMDVTEHQRLELELQHERDHLRLLLDLNNRVALHLDLRQLFQAISSELRCVFNCDFVGLALPESDGKRFRQHMVAFPGGKGLIKEGTLHRAEGTASGRALRTAKPVVIDGPSEFRANWTSEQAEAFYKTVAEEGLQSGCYVPLIASERVLGVLQLVSRHERWFRNQDVEFFDQVTNQIAIPLKNALEYEKVAETKDRLKEQNLYLEEEIRVEHNFEEIIGNSPRLRAVLESVQIVAPAESSVLILGETGTGKELIARAIHDLSPRKDQAFVKVNCAAIPSGLLESELFGHERGAFTGAIAQKIGRFELAHRGTLFLDEVGDIPLELQPKLLRVLQEHEFERLGSTRTQRVDVRLLAATNADLNQMVAEKKFRSDLYYRLNVFPVSVPPLRERRDDIPILVRHFANKYARRMRKQIESIPKETMDALSRYAWPGNIRELQNLMERAVLLSPGPSLRVPLSEIPPQTDPGAASDSNLLQQAERELIVNALRESHWVVGGPRGAAARLRLSRTTLAYKMQKLGISRPRQ